MMYADEPTTPALPRPAPTSSDRDLLMPAFSGFEACVLSIIWARADPPSAHDEAASALALTQSLMVHLRGRILRSAATRRHSERLKILLSLLNPQSIDGMRLLGGSAAVVEWRDSSSGWPWSPRPCTPTIRSG